MTFLVPRKIADAYMAALRNGQTGNFTIHLRRGEPLGWTFEQKESLTDVDREDAVALT